LSRQAIPVSRAKFNPTSLAPPSGKAAGEPLELVKDVNGRLIRGPLNRIVVMEKRTGWGAEYPAELRNGEWEYQVFEPDGKPRANAKHEACFTCHKPKSGQDFVFSYPQLLKSAR
jgi:Cytochrome P460